MSPPHQRKDSKLGLHEIFECFDVSAVVTGTIDRRFGNEGRVRQSQIVEQDPESFFADRSLPDLLVTVELRSARSFRIVAMPYLHVIQSDRGIKMLQGFIESGLANDVVSGNVSVTCVDARANRDDSAQTIQDLRDLLKTSAQREFRAGRVFNENREPARGEVETLR